MLKQYQSKKEQGFTIIEVMIVLAIAGVIMLIVFLAVPALQRNSRNTRRKNDAATAVGALQEALNNANGTLPTQANVTGAAITTTSTVAGIPATIQNGAYGIIDTMDYTIVANGTNAALPGNIADNHTVIVRNNLKCNSNGATAYVPTPAAQPTLSVGSATTSIATTVGASVRTFVVIYAVEGTNGNNIAQCLDN
jgi:prepilin-type N-terminal cleavage/methylation domain-containing protein